MASCENQGILVQFGGVSIKGPIPPTHIFDNASGGHGGTYSYRSKIRSEK